MIERTTIRLSPELLRLAKRKAAEEGCTLTSLIEEGLRLRIAEDRRKPERVLPRVSSAKGRELIDITRFSDIQEMDDLEYAERLKNGFK